MTEQELRDKIIGIVLDIPITGVKIREILGGEATANAIADALIAAGIGDVSWWERKCKLCEEDWFLQKKQIEHYAESYKEMLQEDLDKYRHRAEVAERALLNSCVNHIRNQDNNVDVELLARVAYSMFLRIAEKELAEEKI